MAMLQRNEIMDIKQLYTALPSLYKVAVYVPEVQRVTKPEDDGDFDKFGGLPSIWPGFEYPICETCGHEMQFFFQLTSPIDDETISMFRCIQHRDVCSHGDQNALYYISYTGEEAASIKHHSDEKRVARFKKYAYSYPEGEHHAIPPSVRAKLAPQLWKNHPSLLSGTYVHHWLNHNYGKWDAPDAYDHPEPVSEDSKEKPVQWWERAGDEKAIPGMPVGLTPPGLMEQLAKAKPPDPIKKHHVIDWPYQCFRVVKWREEVEIANTPRCKGLLSRWVKGGKISADLLKQAGEKIDAQNAYFYSHRPGHPKVEGELREQFIVNELIRLLQEVATPDGLECVRFGGHGDSCQGYDYSNCLLHIGTTDYLPYMWGDAGYAHIDDCLDVKMDCG